MPIVAVTTMIGTTFGNKCWAMIRLLLAPAACAASTNSFSFSETRLTAHETRRGHPVDQAEADENAEQTAALAVDRCQGLRKAAGGRRQVARKKVMMTITKRRLGIE